MSNILSDNSLLETTVSELEDRLLMIDGAEDLTEGEKCLYILIDNDPDFEDKQLKDVCKYILRFRRIEPRSNGIHSVFEVLEESCNDKNNLYLRDMIPSNVGSEFIVSDRQLERDGVMLYKYDKNRIEKTRQSYERRTATNLKLPDQITGYKLPPGAYGEIGKYLGGKTKKIRRRRKIRKSNRRKRRSRSSRRR